MNPNQPYSPEQTAQVLQLYALSIDLETIGLTVNKSTRSIISKLVREGVYKTQAVEPPRLRKAQMIEQICTHLGLEYQELESLEKATYPALQLLHKQTTQN